MNDDYLRDYYAKPPREFTEKLSRQLSQLPGETPVSNLEPARRPVRRYLSWAFAALLVVVLALFLTPPGRAIVEDVVRRAGNILVRETANYPGQGNPTVTGSSETMTLAEARAEVGFSFAIPQSIPEGYTLDTDSVQVVGSPGSQAVLVRWNRPDGKPGFGLRVEPSMPDVELIIGPESSETVTIGETPGLLIRGGWDADSEEWRWEDWLRDLRWEQDGVTYTLSTWGDHLTDGELLAIAESVAE